MAAGQAIAVGTPAPGAASFTVLPMSLRQTSDVALGTYASAKMSVAVVLAPSNQSALTTLLTDV